MFGASPEKCHALLIVTADIKGNDVYSDDLEKAMYNLWRQGGGNPSTYNNDNELVLGASTGTCYVCKNQGHNVTDCPSKNKGGGGGKKDVESLEVARRSSWAPVITVVSLAT
jgi:hypothetical protein